MEQNKVTLSRVPGWDAVFVEVNGIKRGIIWPDTGHWIASRMGCYRSTNPAHIHGRFAVKQTAIDAIVLASRNEPKCIVYPNKDENVCANWNSIGVNA